MTNGEFNRDPQGPNLYLVPGLPSEIDEELGLQAVEQVDAYRSGEEQLDMEWIQSLLEDPEKGEILEGMLRNWVGAGRRTAAQVEGVNEDTRIVAASILDPTVVLPDHLSESRDGFLRMLDGLNPARHQSSPERPNYWEDITDTK